MTNEKFRELVLSSGEFKGTNAESKTRELTERFVIEKGYEIARIGFEKAMESWLRGLPSLLDYPLYYCDISKWAGRELSDEELRNYFPRMAIEAVDLVYKYITVPKTTLEFFMSEYEGEVINEIEFEDGHRVTRFDLEWSGESVIGIKGEMYKEYGDFDCDYTEPELEYLMERMNEHIESYNESLKGLEHDY